MVVPDAWILFDNFSILVEIAVSEQITIDLCMSFPQPESVLNDHLIAQR
jgi:hypothetical protein